MMGLNIETVADFLNELLKREKSLISSINIAHPGSIGDMYEGLSKKLLSRAIFKGLDVKITDGFVKGQDGKLSKQIDCMLVTGNGQQIPNTNHYIYDFENVITVLESKTDLFSKEISASYENMLSISDNFVPSNKTGTTFQDIANAFEYLTGSRFKMPVSQLGEKEQYYYHILVVMFAMPLRIVFGYNGFSSEFNFRKSYIEYLQTRTGKMGTGPNSMPDLLICSNYSIIKCNFQPLKTQVMEQDFIPYLISGTENPLYYLVLMLWAKLQIRFNLPDSIWDFDTDSLLQIKRFLDIKFDLKKKGWGYKYYEMTRQQLENIPPKEDWKPLEVSKEIGIIAVTFCKYHPEYYDLTKMWTDRDTVEKIKKELKQTRLFAIEGDKVYQLARQLACCIQNDKNYVADNCDGDFSLWITKQRKEK